MSNLRCTGCGLAGPMLTDAAIGFKHHCGGTWQRSNDPCNEEHPHYGWHCVLPIGHAGGHSPAAATPEGP